MGNDEVKSIHLVDPSAEVINTLENKLIDSYITKKHLIHVHWKRGQDLILGSEKKIIFIAGMGGGEIQEIIQNLLPQFTSEDRLVISPHRNILELRRYLHQSEFGIVDEIVVNEAGQFYQILCLVKSEALPKVSLYGSQIWLGSAGKEYREHQLRFFRQHQDELSKSYVAHLAQLSY